MSDKKIAVVDLSTAEDPMDVLEGLLEHDPRAKERIRAAAKRVLENPDGSLEHTGFAARQNGRRGTK